MDEKAIDEELKVFEKKHHHNWQYLAYKLRKHLDIWALKNVKNPAGDIKQSYLPVIFNVTAGGSTASKITARSMVIKQNLSHTIGELKKAGMIFTEPDIKDKRSERLYLTTSGKELVLDAHRELEKLQNEYARLVGEQELQNAAEVLLKLIAYHESLDEK